MSMLLTHVFYLLKLKQESATLPFGSQHEISSVASAQVPCAIVTFLLFFDMSAGA